MSDQKAVIAVDRGVDEQSDSPNRMDRRRLETRQKLINATLKLIAEKGVDKTTMSNITETADLGRRTFYYHFESKEECIIAAAVGQIQRHSIAVLNLVSQDDDPALVVATACQFVVSALMKEPVTMSLLGKPRMLGSALFDAIGQFVMDDINTGIEQNRFAPPLRGKLLENMLKWSLVGLVIEVGDSELDEPDSLLKYAQTFLMMLGLPIKEAKDISLQAAEKLS